MPMLLDIKSFFLFSEQDAADKCVSVEFVLFDQSASHLSNVQENINCFARSLADLDNCSFQTFLPG